MVAHRKMNFIERIFSLKEGNPFGYYSVWLCVDGQWKYTSVDDKFPWQKQKKYFFFCRPSENSIWPMVIEKAWAKLLGSYSKLWGGETNTALRAITGAPV